MHILHKHHPHYKNAKEISFSLLKMIHNGKIFIFFMQIELDVQAQKGTQSKI